MLSFEAQHCVTRLGYTKSNDMLSNSLDKMVLLHNDIVAKHPPVLAAEVWLFRVRVARL